MKKTISINIGGIIFHIEEDGYQKLKEYLDSINEYFSSFDDSSEITSDIEGRIAELFLLKLTDGRQTLNIEDVEELINTMGTTSDFKASITDEPDEQPQPEQKDQQGEETEKDQSDEPKRLYRDTKRGMLGGVAAGIAHYFSIDPLWIRLLMLALFVNIFFYGFSGAIFVAYIILWVVVPPKRDLVDNQKVKKLYRNPEERVLGGVASGLAAYFGVDVVVIRLLFVLFIFLGASGVLAYIILWIITPEAKSITEKMQMSGKPVTLKNIETSVKKSFKVKEGEESPWVKILLFPFRLVAAILEGLGRFLGPFLRFLVDAIRLAFGAFLMLIGFAFMAGLLGSFMTIVGADTWLGHVDIDGVYLPLELVRQSLDIWMVLGVFLVAFIPSVSFILLGLVIILKRSVASPFVGWSLFAMWILGVILASITIPRFVTQFAESSTIRTEDTYKLTPATPMLYLNDIGADPFDGVDVRLRGHNDSLYVALIETESRGRSRSQAQENAEYTIYNIKKDGEDFYFDSKLSFKDDAQYRMQQAEVTFYIPYNKPFRMDKDLEDILSNTIGHYGYKDYQIENNEWVFKENKGLVCLTCRSYEFDNEEDKDEEADENLDLNLKHKKRSYSDSDELDYPFENFNELKIGSVFDIEIRKSENNDFDVRIRGEERDLDEVYMNQVGERLEVKFKRGDWKWWKDQNDRRVKLIIAMPELESIDIHGSCEGEITGFEQDDLRLKVSGVSDIYTHVDIRNLEIRLDGNSNISLKGKGETLDIEVQGASKINSLDYRTNEVSVETHGASKAIIYAKNEIKARAEGMSSIRYRGTDDIQIEQDGMSSVKRY